MRRGEPALSFARAQEKNALRRKQKNEVNTLLLLCLASDNVHHEVQV